MKFIYQIGRFDRNYNEDINFVIDSKNFKSKLSSISLKNYLQGQTKLILIYPVSIVYNEIALNNNDEFSKIISQKIGNYLENPNEVLKEHPHNKYADDFLVIHSIGEYKLFDSKEKFEGTYDDIVLAIFCDMVERLLEKKNEENEFYIDISSGHNIYVSAMLEAIRHFSVFSKLLNWQNKSFRPKVYIVFSDPILGSSAKEFKIYIKELKFKVFFSSPIGKYDMDMMEKESELYKLLENFLILYSAIKNNTPLVLYHFGYDEYGKIIASIRKIIEEIKNKLSENWKKSPSLSKDDYLKIILSLGFYAGIVEVLESNNIREYNFQEGVALDEIKEKFLSKSIYKIFNLDSLVPILEYEIKSQYGKSRKIKKEEWEKLGKYYDHPQSKGGNFQRHFIAHSGFERNITEVRKKDNKLYFRYQLNGKRKDLISVLKNYL
jgi:CRISPR-associated protein Csx1